MNLLLKADKANKRRKTVTIKFIMKIIRDHKEAIMFDANNANKNWKDAELLKLKQIYNCDPFNSLGPFASAHIPPDHTKIQVNLIYDYRQDGRYKAHMVDSGDMTGPNRYTYYSSIISIRSMRTVVFLDELENIEAHKYDISNA